MTNSLWFLIYATLRRLAVLRSTRQKIVGWSFSQDALEVVFQITMSLRLPLILVLLLAAGPAAFANPVCDPYRKLVVRISVHGVDGSRSDGFGFVVGERHGHLYIATAAHVVRGPGQPTAAAKDVRLRFFWDPGSEVDGVELLDVRPRTGLDLALLRIGKDMVVGSADEVSWHGKSWCARWQEGEQVWFVGRSRDWYAPLHENPGYLRGGGAGQGLLQVESLDEVQPGTSGAPLIARSGIVGMIVRDDLGSVQVVDVGQIRRFVAEENPYPWNLAECSGSDESPPANNEGPSVPPAVPSAPASVAEPKPGEVRRDESTGMELAWVPGGCFRMGSAPGEEGRGDDEGPVHEVCVDGLWMGRYEVTQGQWQQVTGENPSKFQKGGDWPVEQVSWNDVQEFVRKLNAKSGRSYRLPTEAEWEHACRGGVGSTSRHCGSDDPDAVAWHGGNSDGSTHSVGRKAGNGLGLHDMSGNVWEWCSDWYAGDYYAKGVRDNPRGPAEGSDRVLRGGSFFRSPSSCRSVNRSSNSPGHRHVRVGFRLALSAKGPAGGWPASPRAK